MNKNRGTILSILGILSLMLLTIQITYSFFNYTKEGTTENSITTGTITFIYEEIEKNGSGISIENAYPVSDDIGKNQSDAKEVFNFKVASTTINKTEIPYTITARKKAGSTLDETAVKLYLTEVNGETETPLTESTYQSLPNYTNVPQTISEKVLYTGVVPEKSTNYVKNYRLRMWIPSVVDFSPLEDGTYPYNGKTFTVTVNVYANAKVVTIPNEPVGPFYAFGNPTTQSSTNFLDVIAETRSNTFAKLDGEELSLCIYRNKTLECFRNDNYEEETEHMIRVFGQNSCSVSSSFVYCYTSDFTCFLYSSGDINCNYRTTNKSCMMNAANKFSCI